MNFVQRLALQKEREDLIGKWGRVFGGSEAANIIAFRRSLGRSVWNDSEDAIFQREEDQALAFRRVLGARSSHKNRMKNLKGEGRRSPGSRVRLEGEKA